MGKANTQNRKKIFLGTIGGGLLGLLVGCGEQADRPQYDAGTDSKNADTSSYFDSGTDNKIDAGHDGNNADTATNTDLGTANPTIDSFAVTGGNIETALIIIDSPNANNVFVDIYAENGTSDQDISCNLSGSIYRCAFAKCGFYSTLTANAKNTSQTVTKQITYPPATPLKILDLYVDSMGRNEGEALGTEQKLNQYVLSYTDWQTRIKPSLGTAGITASHITQIDNYQGNLDSKVVNQVMVTKTSSGGKLIYRIAGSNYFGLDVVSELVYESIDVTTSEIDGLINFIENN